MTATEPYTNARFAEAVAYLTKVTAQWAAEALMLPEELHQPVRHYAIDRFCAEVRERVSYIEERAVASAAAHRSEAASYLTKVTAQWAAESDRAFCEAVAHAANGGMSSPETRAQVDGVVEAVRADLLRRSQLGIAKYGVTLDREDLSLRDWLQHAYEETLDQANYLKRAIIELDRGRP